MTRRTPALAFALAFALAAAGCDSATEPDDRPPEVVFTSVSAAVGSPGGWLVPTAMENRGGPGLFNVRFYATATEDPDDPEVLCGFTNDIAVERGWSDAGDWSVPCQSRPRTAVVRSIEPGVGEPVETDRVLIPES